MAWSEEQIRGVLRGRSVLIIEDDRNLGPQLERLFRNFDVREVLVRRCAEGADQGGLDYLRRGGDTLDLLCVDNMLPWDEPSLRRCDELQSEWDDLQRAVRALREKPDQDEQIGEMRARLMQLSDSIRATIDREAGLKMIRQWWSEMNRRFGPQWMPRLAIMFLTAREQRSMGAEAEEIAKHAKWVSKPALELQVVTAAAELIVERDNRKQ